MLELLRPFTRFFGFIENYWEVLLFYVLIVVVIYLNRSKFEIQAKIIALYRTKFGLKLMDKIATRWNTLVKNLSYVGIPMGFIGMIAMVFMIIYGLYTLLFKPDAPPTITPVLPGLPIVGTEIQIPFVAGLLALFIVVVIHEFSHGVIARANKVKVKSSGFVMFGPLPGAFVEPDEKQMQKDIAKFDKNRIPQKTPWLFFIITSLILTAFIGYFSTLNFAVVQNNIEIFTSLFVAMFAFLVYTSHYFYQRRYYHLAIFAAGPFSNILTVVLITVVIFFAVGPLMSNLMEIDGFTFVSIVNDTPAASSDLQIFQKFTKINDIDVRSLYEFNKTLSQFSPGDTIQIGNETHMSSVTLGEHPDDPLRAYIGIIPADYRVLKPGLVANIYPTIAPVVSWIFELIKWIIILSLGLGLANLLPLGPIDGGRMFQVILHMGFGEERGNVVWGKVAVILLAVIAILIFAPFVKILFF